MPTINKVDHPPIATIRLNRPARHNSLIPEMLKELQAALQHIGEQEDIRAVMLFGEGPSFSTGGDVAAFYAHRDQLAEYSRRVVGLLHEVMLSMMRLPVPVVVGVHGLVTGGSLGFLLASDVVLVAPEASISPWYGVVGFSPDGGWTALLPEVIGRRRAAEVLVTNGVITAAEAVAWGLANRMVPAGDLEAEALRIASMIGRLVPDSVRRTNPSRKP